MAHIARLRTFVLGMTDAVTQCGDDEALILERGQTLLSSLISHDDWLPEAFARPSTEGYRQYLLYCDPLERFSVVSFVWGPGQRTPIHDHTVWGMVGMMRGKERCEEFGDPSRGERLEKTAEHLVEPGEIETLLRRHHLVLHQHIVVGLVGGEAGDASEMLRDHCAQPGVKRPPVMLRENVGFWGED